MAAGFACPSCGRHQRFKLEVANQRVSCIGCGRLLIAPAEAGGQATICGEPELRSANYESSPASTGSSRPTRLGDEAGYDVDLPDDVPPPAPVEEPSEPNQGRCPSCGSAMKPEAVLCLNCGYHLHQQAALRTAVESPAPRDTAQAKPADSLSDARPWESPLRHIYSPIVLLVAGVMLIWLDTLVIFDAANFSGNPTVLRRQYLLSQGFAMLVQLPFLCGGLLVLWLFGTRFSHLSLAILKMVALVVMAAALTGCAQSLSYRLGLQNEIWHLPFTWAVGLATFWAVATWLFELRVLETLVLYLVTVLLPIQTAHVVLGLLREYLFR